MKAKRIFYEEAARVPLMMKFPGFIAENLTVHDPVSHLDVFSTIMDYFGAPELDKSDGHTLRRFVEDTSYNQDGDPGDALIVEIDPRYPIDNTTLKRELAECPNYSVVLGDFKLMMAKLRSSPTLDMMFNVKVVLVLLVLPLPGDV